MLAHAPVPRVSILHVDLGLVDALERASITCWPPTYVEDCSDGWVLRATPGIERGRSSFALTPRMRSLASGELPVALERVRAWSKVHGLRGGVQFSPLELHGDCLASLLAAGWEPAWHCWVMSVDRLEALKRAEALGLGVATSQLAEAPWVVEREASPAWVANWMACQPAVSRAAVDLNVRTVFGYMGARGIFGRVGSLTSGIAVEDEVGDWTGLYSLVVRADARGQGLGRQLVRSLLETTQTRRVFLQVETQNDVALALYRSFGFQISHSYQHLLAPAGWAA